MVTKDDLLYIIPIMIIILYMLWPIWSATCGVLTS